MCSRYSITSPPEAIRELFGYAARPNFPARYNIAPTQPVPVVRLNSVGEREFVLVRWGLIPPWVKDPAQFSTLINARAETACEKPSFKNALRRRRCLFPTDGFYEWMGPRGKKRPFLIRQKDHKPFALAGIWEHWMDSEGSEMESAAILTVEANAVVGVVHNRMPAIVQSDDFEEWLDREMDNCETAQTMLRPAADELLELCELDPRINSSRVEGADVRVFLTDTTLL